MHTKVRLKLVRAGILIFKGSMKSSETLQCLYD